LLPGTQSALSKVKGPEPTCFSICLKGSVRASSSRMTKSGTAGLESCSSTGAKGDLRRISKSSAPVATTSSTWRISVMPLTMRADQRLSEATASLASTGEPSWKTSPGRRAKRQTMPSSLFDQRSTICGCGRSAESSANRTS